MAPLIAHHARKIAAALLVAIALWSAALPAASPAERAHRASAFKFDAQPLPEPADTMPTMIRSVHPSLERIAAWISAVGASVALVDLNGDGLPNEACHVDPRFGEVRISAVDRPERFASFVVPLDALPYDPRTMAPTGCLPGDFDEDGRADLLVYFWGRTPILFMQGDDDHFGPAVFAAHELLASGERWFTNAATRADLDGDGHADLVIANYFPDGARVLEAGSNEAPQTMQHSMTRAANGGTTHLFLWAGVNDSDAHSRVAFREIDQALPADAAHRWTLAAGAADLDGDLLPELYFANDFGPDALLHNVSTPGHVRFRQIRGRRSLWMPASKTLGRDSFKGMGIDFGDLNGDGVPDLYVSNIAEEYALLESHFLFVSTGRLGATAGDIAPYVDASEDLGLSRGGWAWDAKLDDFDNDGVFEAVQATGFLRGVTPRWAELQELATGNDQLLKDPRSWPRFGRDDDLSGRGGLRFLTRHGDGRYYDVADLVGFGNPRVSRGIAIADVDGDGRLDLAVANQWDQSFAYTNRAPSAGAFIGLHLRRPLDSGRAFYARAGHPSRDDQTTPAIGASVQVFRGGTLLGSREVDGGNGHSGRRSSDLHVGLGNFHESVRVDIRWRGSDGTPQQRSIQLAAGWHTVVLGESATGTR